MLLDGREKKMLAAAEACLPDHALQDFRHHHS
jgi:hypothetical protein